MRTAGLGVTVLVGRVIGVIGVGVSLASGCDRCGGASGPAPSSTKEGEEGGSRVGTESADGGEPAGHRPSRGDAHADLAALDGGIAKECVGSDIALGRAVVDPRCETTSKEAKALVALLEADGGLTLLTQDANLEPDGRVTVRILNASDRPVALPLSWHPRLPAFSVVAEDAQHALFELEPPRLEVGAPDAGPLERAHIARIVLGPGGAAKATTTIGPGIVRRLDRACRDGGAPADGGCPRPSKLSPGTYVLHVGQLIADVQTGPPARITWSLR